MKNHKKFMAAAIAAAAFLVQSQAWSGEYTDKSYHGDEGHEERWQACRSADTDTEAFGTDWKAVGY